MCSAAKIKSFYLPFWGPCLRWIKESNKISLQTFNFPGLQAFSLSLRNEGGFEPSVASWETFPSAVTVDCSVSFFFYIGEKERKREGQKKNLLPTCMHSFFYWPSSFLAKKKLHSVENSHFSLNPQFKHDPEWKIAKQEACKLHQSNVVRHGSKRPFMRLALGMRPAIL